MTRNEEHDEAYPEILAHYEVADEHARLGIAASKLEWVRTVEILDRYLPRPPATILDVGGGPGPYACVLARRGHAVHLVDPVPLHVEQALAASAGQPERPLASAVVGDARKLEADDRSADVVLLLGPLYHLPRREDRLRALAEARRVVRPGGRIFAAAISRFASTMDGIVRHLFDDPAFARIAERDLVDGRHRNDTGNPAYFTTAYFHRVEDLRAEIVEAGLTHEATLGVEGPCWLLQDFDEQWSDERRRERLVRVARALEAEPSLLGASAHLLAVARRPR